jgi:hypothetical protein
MMSIVWGDPRTEQQLQALREISTRLLAETNPKRLDALIEQLTQIIQAQLLSCPPN